MAKILSAVPWQLDWDLTGLSRRLIGQLSAIGAEGFDVEVCTPGEGRDYGLFRSRQVKSKLIQGDDPITQILNTVAFSDAFSGTASDVEHDLVHCFNTTSHFLKERRVLQMLNPTSAFVKEALLSEYPKTGKYLKKLNSYDVAAALEERECAGADVVIASSRLAKENIARLYGRKEGVEVIKTGLEPSMVCQDYAKQKNRLKMILFPNRISVMKGFRYMPEAMRRIRKEFPASILVVSGRIDDFDREAIEGDLKELKEMRGITLTGYVSRKVLMNYYQMADIVAVPSLCEDISLSLLDAVAMATPVIATEEGGFPQVDDVGIKIPAKDSEAFAEAAIKLLSDDALYEKKRERARAVVKDYLWQEIGKRYSELYNKFL